MSTSMWIARSDTTLDATSFNLNNTNDPAHGCTVKLDSLKLPPPEERATTQAATIAVTFTHDDSMYTLRQISMELLMQHDTTTDLNNMRRSLTDLLDTCYQTTGKAGGQWVGQPVTFWCQMLDSSVYVLFDVVKYTMTRLKWYGAGTNRESWQLVLYCLPFGRAQVQGIAATGTLTNGPNSTISVQIPGDRRALCQYTVTSLGSTNLAGFRIGVRSNLYSVNHLAVAQVAAVSPGVTFADTSAMNGVNTARLTTSPAWQTVGVATVAAGQANGLMRLMPHIRDASSNLGPQTALSGYISANSGATGTISAGSNMFVLTELDGSGNETAQSAPVVVVVGSSQTQCEVTLSWNITGSPSNQRLYWLDPTGGWHSQLLGSGTLTTYTITSWSFSGGSNPPPATPALALMPCQVRVRVGMNVANPSWSAPSAPFTPQVRGGQWELADGGIWTVPPLIRQEGLSDVGYKILVEARTLGSGSPTFDCDGIWQFPYDEPSQLVEYPGLNPGIAGTFYVDNRRDGRASARFTDQASPPNDVALCVPQGFFTLGPGTNILVFQGEGPNGVVDVQNLKYSVNVNVIPRYYDLTGIIWL